MIQIRQGCFETNSSSAHCLVISEKDEKYTAEDFDWIFYWDKSKKGFAIPERAFGRHPFEILSDFTDKFVYALGALSKEYGDEYWDQFEDFLKKYVDPDMYLVPKDNEYQCHYFKDKLEAEDYCKLINSRLARRGLEGEYGVSVTEAYKGSFRVQDYHSIYVEDYGGLKRYFEENNLTVEEFLLSKKYVIIVDGDEYYIWKDLKELGLINKNIKEVQF